MNINMKHDNKAVLLWESCDYFPVKIHLFLNFKNQDSRNWLYKTGKQSFLAIICWGKYMRTWSDLSNVVKLSSVTCNQWAQMSCSWKLNVWYICWRQEQCNDVLTTDWWNKFLVLSTEDILNAVCFLWKIHIALHSIYWW